MEKSKNLMNGMYLAILLMLLIFFTTYFNIYQTSLLWDLQALIGVHVGYTSKYQEFILYHYWILCGTIVSSHRRSTRWLQGLELLHFYFRWALHFPRWRYSTIYSNKAVIYSINFRQLIKEKFLWDPSPNTRI